MSAIKIATYNVRHFSTGKLDEVDYSAFIQAIRSLDADIVGINESYGPDSRFGEKAQVEVIAEAMGWNWFFAPAVQVPGWGIYGNSVLTRFPFIKADCIPIPDPKPVYPYKHYESRCILVLDVETQSGPLTVAVTHFGLNPAEQEMALKTVRTLVRPHRFILMGDLNLTPDAPIISSLSDLLQDTGKYLRHEQSLSFPSDKPDRKIDYIFVTSDILVKDAEILSLTVSDHRPYKCSLELK